MATAIIICNKTASTMSIFVCLLVNKKNHQVIEFVADVCKYVLTFLNAEIEHLVTAFIAGITIIVWFPVCKYVLTLLNAENEHSVTAFIAGITIIVWLKLKLLIRAVSKSYLETLKILSNHQNQIQFAQI